MAFREITIPAAEIGVLIFSCPAKFIREKFPGVQIGNKCGGLPAPASQTADEGASPYTTVSNLRIGFDSLLEHYSIRPVTVLEDSTNGYCQVYINYRVDSKNLGYNHWTPVYRDFIRNFLSREYRSVKFKLENGKVSLKFSTKPVNAKVETKIMFVAAEKSTAEPATEKPAAEAIPPARFST